MLFEGFTVVIMQNNNSFQSTQKSTQLKSELS